MERKLISFAREEDRKARTLMLEAMAVLLRLGKLSDAKVIGECSAKMARKIQTHDYSQADAWLAKERAIIG